MNGWDVFTWICSGVLAGSAIVIFAFFLRDARALLGREEQERDER